LISFKTILLTTKPYILVIYNNNKAARNSYFLLPIFLPKLKAKIYSILCL